MPDYYRILGVPVGATLDAIKLAHRQKAMQCHPDRGGSHAKMLEINEAYEVLSNPSRRREYDNARMPPPESPASEGPPDKAAQETHDPSSNHSQEWGEFEKWVRNTKSTTRGPTKHGGKSPQNAPSKAEDTSYWQHIVAVVMCIKICIKIFKDGVAEFRVEFIICALLVIAIYVWYFFLWNNQKSNHVNDNAPYMPPPPPPPPFPPPPPPVSPSKPASPPALRVIQCAHCHKRLRVPVFNGELQVTCPGCRRAFRHVS